MRVVPLLKIELIWNRFFTDPKLPEGLHLSGIFLERRDSDDISSLEQRQNHLPSYVQRMVEGKSTGNHEFSREILGFPLDCLLNQSIDMVLWSVFLNHTCEMMQSQTKHSQNSWFMVPSPPCLVAKSEIWWTALDCPTGR